MNRFEVNSQLTDRERLIFTMHQESKMGLKDATELVDHHLVRCLEVFDVVDGVFCGYFLLFSNSDIISFHGYKFKKQWARTALGMAELFLQSALKKYPVIYSSTNHKIVQKMLIKLKFKKFIEKSNIFVREF